MKTPVRMKSQAGFSLIELMIVVAIIGILATVAIPNFQKFQEKARQSEGKGYMSAMYTGIQSFNSEWNTMTIPCLQSAGFNISGTGVYVAGFKAALAGVVTGYTKPAVCNPNLAPLPAGGIALPAVATLNSTAPTATTFVVSVSGNINGNAAAPDVWTINELNAVAHTKDGI